MMCKTLMEPELALQPLPLNAICTLIIYALISNLNHPLLFDTYRYYTQAEE